MVDQHKVFSLAFKSPTLAGVAQLIGQELASSITGQGTCLGRWLCALSPVGGAC